MRKSKVITLFLAILLSFSAFSAITVSAAADFTAEINAIMATNYEIPQNIHLDSKGHEDLCLNYLRDLIAIEVAKTGRGVSVNSVTLPDAPWDQYVVTLKLGEDVSEPIRLKANFENSATPSDKVIWLNANASFTTAKNAVINGAVYGIPFSAHLGTQGHVEPCLTYLKNMIDAKLAGTDFTVKSVSLIAPYANYTIVLQKTGSDQSYPEIYLRADLESNNNLDAKVVWLNEEIAAPKLVVTADKYTVKKGENLNVNAAFTLPVDSNTAILTYTYDPAKFEFRALDLADGVTAISVMSTDYGVLRLTVMVDGYNTQNYGNVVFFAKEDYTLNTKDCFIVDVTYVLKDSDGNKSIVTDSGVIPPTLYTLIDLSDVIDMHGVTKDSADWNAAKRFDHNRDGKIDILDIVNVSRYISFTAEW